MRMTLQTIATNLGRDQMRDRAERIGLAESDVLFALPRMIELVGCLPPASDGHLSGHRLMRVINASDAASWVSRRSWAPRAATNSGWRNRL